MSLNSSGIESWLPYLTELYEIPCYITLGSETLLHKTENHYSVVNLFFQPWLKPCIENKIAFMFILKVEIFPFPMDTSLEMLLIPLEDFMLTKSWLP